MKGDGTGLRSLTGRSDDRYSDPAWSPDGTQLAVSFRPDRDSWLVVLRADGTGPRPVTSIAGLYSGDDFAPAWSPQGQDLVYTSYGVVQPETTTAIFRVRLSDKRRRGVFAGTEQPLERAVRAANQFHGTRTFPFAEDTPDWSPDGRWIAFTRWKGDAQQHGSYGGWIMLMHPDGTGLKKLTAGTNPDWSPDGSRIVYDQFAHIYTISPSGHDKTRLTRTADRDYDPAWSPDGRLILYTQANRRSAGLWVMNADGSNPRRIARHAFEGSWQPVPIP
jgi:Tol biopolymer transport system component